MRVFVAVDVDNAHVLKEVGDLHTSMADVRKFVELHNLHFTLSFLGEIDADLVKKISKKLSCVSFKPFDVRLQGIGLFGGSRRRVVWIGTDDKGGQSLKLLAADVSRMLAKYGVHANKSFRPHLTILRVKKRDLGAMFQRFNDKVWGIQSVTSFKLKQSVLGTQGPTYTDVVRVDAI